MWYSGLGSDGWLGVLLGAAWWRFSEAVVDKNHLNSKLVGHVGFLLLHSKKHPQPTHRTKS
jgi:hypothetical protein